MKHPALGHPPPRTATHVLIGRLWRDWIRKYAGRIALGSLLMTVSAVATGLYPMIVEAAVDMLDERDRELVWLVPPAIVAIALIKGSAAYGHTIVTMGLALRVIADLQRAMFAHLMRADLALFHSTSTGRLVSRFVNDVNLLRDALSKALTGMVLDTLTLIALVGAMIYLDWLLTLIVFFVFPLSVWPILRVGRRLRNVSASTQEEMGQFTSLLTEAFAGARLIKSFRMEAHQGARANGVVENVLRLVTKAVRGRARLYPILEVLGGTAVAAVLTYGTLTITSGEGSLGTLTGFLTALFMVYQPMRRLGNLNASLQEGLASADRIFAVLDQPPQILDAPGAKPLTVSAGEIRIEGVAFTYDGGKAALRGIDLVAPAGNTVALVGPSGAGKSTVLNLIPRFYDLSHGRVSIDGQDIKQVSVASLRDQISLVSQDVTLFNDTVRTNIGFGRPDADYGEIVEAAKAAAADEFIRELTDGYDTIVGDRGVKLSGGQQQRIAIARAMLKDAPILLLDEATSALDTESERQVQLALDRLRRGRTTLVIAHRLSTVAAADLIYVLDDGRVVESGTHRELQRRGGLYERLCRLQFHELELPETATQAG